MTLFKISSLWKIKGMGNVHNMWKNFLRRAQVLFLPGQNETDHIQTNWSIQGLTYI